MKRRKRDPVREDRIHNEAIVDARPEEQAMSWYYYLESKISFPFRARCVAANAVSPLRKGETAEVLRMATEDACGHDMLVQIRWQGRKMAVPLSQLQVIGADESTRRGHRRLALLGWSGLLSLILRTAADNSHHESHYAVKPQCGYPQDARKLCQEPVGEPRDLHLAFNSTTTRLAKNVSHRPETVSHMETPSRYSLGTGATKRSRKMLLPSYNFLCCRMQLRVVASGVIHRDRL
jgi:hypothetical protein